MYKNDPDQPQALAIQVEQEAGTEVTIAKPAMDQPGRDPGTELTGQSQPTVGEEESPIKSCWDFGLSGCFKFDKRERTSWIFNCQGRGCFWVTLNVLLHVLVGIPALLFYILGYTALFIVALLTPAFGCMPWSSLYEGDDVEWSSECRAPCYYHCNHV
ncbi:uncharacterized protein LOC116617700 isoform X1 [Nematostella vectensis]|uniref:uncharacterized protein LOC116617700 isoform X1 n=1 Tax=Nematostella vectensis TaxID=45351 RepID=UPI0020771026|nr:uncharacterized protein LOC116617700 isoform X1 [Nematostella vectensis]